MNILVLYNIPETFYDKLSKITNSFKLYAL